MPRYSFFRMKSRSIFIGVIFFFTGTVLFGQSVIISGQVSDAKTGQAMPGVLVVLEGSSGVGAQSQVDGSFRLEVQPGQVKLSARVMGYETAYSKILNVLAGEELKIDFKLKEKAVQLGTFVMSASRYEQELERITMTVDVLKPNIIENKNTTVMKDAIQQIPGVSIVNNEPQIRSGSGFSFGAGSRVLVMVDDMPLLSGDAGRPSWGFLPVENIEQVEVVKGAASVLYGSAALSGVIHIRTAYPRDTPQTKVNVYSGIYNNPRNKDAIYWGKNNPAYTGISFFHSRKVGKTDVVIGGNFFNDNGYKGSVPVNQGDTTLNRFAEQRGEFENRARLNFSLRHQSDKVKGLMYGLNGNAMISRFTQTLIWFNADSGMYRSFPGAITLTQQGTAYIDPWLSYTGSNGWKHHLRNRYYYLDNNNDNNQGNKSHLIYNEYQLQKHFGGAERDLLHFTSGLVSSLTYGNSALYKGNLAPGTSQIAYSNAHNLAAYIQLDKTFFEILNLSVGGRIEYFSITQPRLNKGDQVRREHEAKPVFRAGANLKLGRASFLKASFGQGFRFPTMAEKYIRTQVGPIRIYPNDSLKSESSWNAEMGIKQVVVIGKFKGFIDLTGFVQQFNNNIEFNFGLFGTLQDPLFGLGFSSINIGKTRVSGAEVTFAGQGKIGKWEIQSLAGYTYAMPVTLQPHAPYPVKTTDGQTALTYNKSGSDSSQNILKYRFRHLVRADVELSRKWFSFGISVRYNSYMQNIDKIFLDLDQILPLLGLPSPGVTGFRATHNKGVWVSDMRVHFKLNQSIRLGFVVNNLLNAEYALRPMVIESPRTTAVQLMLAF